MTQTLETMEAASVSEANGAEVDANDRAEYEPLIHDLVREMEATRERIRVRQALNAEARAHTDAALAQTEAMLKDLHEKLNAA